jgi:hypothetical protein
MNKHTQKVSSSTRSLERSNLSIIQESLGYLPKDSVGNTDFTAMCGTAGGPESRSAGKLVETSLQKIVGTLSISDRVQQLIESLIWPFICRRSLCKEWFSDKDYDRFIRSMRKTMLIIAHYETDDSGRFGNPPTYVEILNREQTFIKYWLDTFMCQVFLDDQRPVKEDWMEGPLFVGYCKNFIRRSIARRDVSFIYSLAKGSKMFWPMLGYDRQVLALQKHMDRL